MKRRTKGQYRVKRSTAQIFDLIFKRLIKLSNTAIISFINGLFGMDYPLSSTVEYPSTESISRKLKKLLSDTIIIINGIHVYHIEAQICDDENIAVRVFEYGYAEGLRTQTITDDTITIKFPNTKIIYWETTAKTPDKVTLRLEFPDGSHYDYNVTTLKFLDYSLAEIEQNKLVILLPFYMLKLRKAVRVSKSKQRLKELSDEMRVLISDLDQTVERAHENGLLNEGDMRMITEYIERMFEELYSSYDVFKEVDNMAKGKILTYSEIAAEKARQEEREKAELAAELAAKKATEAVVEEAARNMKLEKLADDIIARVLGMPIEKVKAITV